MSDKLEVNNVESLGYGKIPKLVMQDHRLQATAKAIYAYFCSFAGAGNIVFPSRKKICYDLQISKDTFTKHLKCLIECGYIEVRQERQEGHFARNVYTLCDNVAVYENDVYENDVYDFLGHEKIGTKNNNIKNNSLKNNSDINNRAKRFIPPTVEEVKAYCQERKNNVDAEAFVNFYESKGWYVGRNKMKDWKAAVRTWEKNNRNKPATDPQKVETSYNSEKVRERAQSVPVYERKK